VSAPSAEPLTIDVVSDVVCPWCFIGKRRLEQAIALKPGIPVAVRYIVFPQSLVPREASAARISPQIRLGGRATGRMPRIVMAARGKARL
jgi:predicted DsbA family dithiol-disulfide isomerase